MRRYGRSVLWDLGEVEYRVMKAEGRVNRKENREDRTGREKIVGIHERLYASAVNADAFR